jgi:PAS domain-containing protein
MHNVIRTGERYFSDAEVFVRRDGSTFPVSVISMPLLDGEKYTASVTLFRDISDQKRAEQEREQMIRELQSALAEIKTLRGIVPICSYCKKVRDDEGYWNQVEQYVSDHTEAKFSHGICPTCFKQEMKRLKA